MFFCLGKTTSIPYIRTGRTKILDELNNLLSLQTDEPVLIGYDTTFNVGNNFVSTLVFKHVMFEGGKLIPDAFLIHNRKKQFCHELFFRKLVEVVPNLRSCKGLLVLDRERAVTNAVQKIMPNTQIFYCKNHLRQDLKRWLETHNASRDDKEVYKEAFMTLQQSGSREEFHDDEAELKLFKKDLMVEYFDNHYRKDILNHDVKFVLQEHELYSPEEDMTNNISESLNSVLTKFANAPGISVDKLLISLYFFPLRKHAHVIYSCVYLLL